MHRPPLVLSTFLLLFFGGAVTRLSADELRFNRDVRPILSEACFHCHGPDSATREADLRLDQKDSAMTVIEAGNIDASELDPPDQIA